VELPPFTWSATLPGGATVRSASKLAGDFSDPAAVPEARRALAPFAWTWLRQVHGGGVVVVEEPGACRGVEADAALTRSAGAALAVLTADCAPLALSSEEGVVGVAHAGWRGLVAGVVQKAVASMKVLGASQVFAALGPCIWPHAYAFSPSDLDLVEAELGPAVRATTASGSPALDLPAAVASALEHAGAFLVACSQTCTHCSAEHFSWRARRDQGRQATVVWREPA
jgi:YfiH family protein